MKTMKRVLIVDDETQNAYMLRKLFEGHGYAVDEAQHGAEALVKARQNPPNLIISDLLMPVMDGYTLLSEWRADERLKRLPFIVYTATYTEPKDEQLALSLGADAFILKPADPEFLVARSEEVLRSISGGKIPSEARQQLEEKTLLKEYNEVLVRKLEKRNRELEETNRKLMQTIDDRAKIQDALSRSSDMLNGLLDETPDAVFVKDRQGKYLLINRATERFIGRKAEEVLGKDDSELFPDGDGEVLMNIDREVMESGKKTTAMETLQCPQGLVTFMAHKAPYRDAAGKVIGITGISRDITQIQNAMSELELRNRAMEALTQGVLIADPRQPDSPIIYASPSFERMTGYKASEVIGLNCRFMQGKDTDPAAVAKLAQAINNRQSCTIELINYKKDGTPFWNELSMSPVFDIAGVLTHFIGVQTDVTERRRLEEQFRQSQKMEAIGHLASGIAHDFNNILTVINGYSQLLLGSPQIDASSKKFIQIIKDAGERSAALTTKLLAFGRKQIMSAHIIDINESLRNMEDMLKRVIGENVSLATSYGGGTDHVFADPSQLDQVILNLCVNARDAMPDGGKITIETTNRTFDDSYIKIHPYAKPGHYVMLSVSDTGIGMTEEVREHIFEPFFTTKDQSKGTGLGLSVVYGVVKQSGGFIEVYSEPGHGTSFKIYFPSAEGTPAAAKITDDSSQLPRGTETVLLVEDEDVLRELTRHILSSCGYTVLLAANGEEALSIFDKNKEKIALLLTDVVMPGMGGRKLSEQITAASPKIKTIYMSGYTDDAVVRHGILHDKVSFLQKPFLPLDLARKVYEVLHSNG